MTQSATSLLDKIREILLKQSVSTQEDILRLLTTQGLTTTQSKISRTLRKLGAIKVLNEKGIACYRLPDEIAPPPGIDSAAKWIVEINMNETMLVMRTIPGAASLIARFIDYNKQADILSTLAGDDTILIIPTSVKKLTSILEELKGLFEL